MDWSTATIWRPPGWITDPSGLGIPDQVTWFPVVTWIQETADLMSGFSAAPGFGHDYCNAMTSAWAAVVPPVGWTAEDAARLDHDLGLA